MVVIHSHSKKQWPKAIAFMPAALFMRADPITKGGQERQKNFEESVVDGSLTAILGMGRELMDVKPSGLATFYTFKRTSET